MQEGAAELTWIFGGSYSSIDGTCSGVVVQTVDTASDSRGECMLAGAGRQAFAQTFFSLGVCRGGYMLVEFFNRLQHLFLCASS